MGWREDLIILYVHYGILLKTVVYALLLLFGDCWLYIICGRSIVLSKNNYQPTGHAALIRSPSRNNCVLFGFLGSMTMGN